MARNIMAICVKLEEIAERAFIVGMRRMVYRCDGVAMWTRIDQGVRCAEDDESDAGFNSIHGFNETDIYAVGGREKYGILTDQYGTNCKSY